MIIPFFSFSDVSLSRLVSILKASLLYVHTQIFRDNTPEIVGLFRKEEKTYVIRKIIIVTDSNNTEIVTRFNANSDLLMTFSAVATDKTNVYTLDNSNFSISLTNNMIIIDFDDIKNTGNVFDITIEITYGVINASSA